MTGAQPSTTGEPAAGPEHGGPRRQPAGRGRNRAFLQEGWVIANHILVSFHAAFISSVLALPSLAVAKDEVLRFVFLSSETLVSALLMYVSFHVGIAIHEMGHFLTAARLNALNESIVADVQARLGQPRAQRWLYYAQVFLLAPWGRAKGIKREGLNYYPDAPYNLAVAAAGPRASRNAALATLPPAVVLIAIGLAFSAVLPVYVGRLLLGIGVVTLLDFMLADKGKYREFQERERKARQTAAALPPATGWIAQVARVKQRLVDEHMYEAIHPRLGPVSAPWQFRNCGMGGRHTEKEYPESNISMQEAMFLILGARDYLEAQEMTVQLQTRLKEMIESAEGCRVMGIGLEGGLAPYVERGDYPLPEVRLWAMMKQAIEECGFRPGEDVAIALDPAMSELEIAYREEFGVPDSVGLYLFWRDKTKVVLDRDGLLELYDQAMRQYDIPILSIEDGFSEDDHEGWRKLRELHGDRILIVGDDLVTTNDATIEEAAELGLINSVLIKANQIGTLHETLLAMLVALGKDLTLVVSHRSKSPNDDMEAHIALATNALGLKAGGGANTERLIKYHAVASQMVRLTRPDELSDLRSARAGNQQAVVVDVVASEEPTNAGVPTVGVEVELELPDSGLRLAFRGATPLGTSAGTGEAVHLVDSMFEGAEHAEIVARHGALLREVESGVHAFRKDVAATRVRETGDDELIALYARAERYQGKGCLNAADNVREVIAPRFRGRELASDSFLSVDRALLQLERRSAERRGKLAADAPAEQVVQVMQRKQNLGMNAVLSVSLALARAIAHVQGRQLWELLREEMMAIVEKLAGAHQVAISGSRWADYVTALREVAQLLAAQDQPLHAELRRLTGVYDNPELAPPATVSSPSAPRGQAAQPMPETAAAVAGMAEVQSPFSEPQAREISELSRMLYDSFVRTPSDEDGRRQTVHHFLGVRGKTLESIRPFEIVNNHLLRSDGQLVVPYAAGEALVIHTVRDGKVEVALRRFPPGTIITDALISRATGLTGELVDLESELFGYHPESAPAVRISRIRDMAALLKELNTSSNYYEAVYFIRCMVVRLCSLTFRGFLGAKNLQPEVQQLNDQLVLLLNGPLAHRLRLPLRVLVRNVSGLVLRPNLIDQVWNDAIDLAEIHIRGSSISNELRRSSHHALGKPTLELAVAYLGYLQTGSADELTALGAGEVSPADEAARQQTAPRKILTRIVHNLEKLLGSSQIVTRIREWQEAYADTLMRCEFGKSLDEELEALLVGGIRARNRWVLRHHLRILGKKAAEAAALAGCAELVDGLAALQAGDPDAPDFDAEAAERRAEHCVGGIVAALREAHQEGLFLSLTEALSCYERDGFMETFQRVASLRSDLDAMVGQNVFPEQRYLLYQLDCLLEEMGYLALRHLASSYKEEGVRLDECLEIVRLSSRILVHSGLHSDEVCGLTSMLYTSGRSFEELLNVLDAVQHAYHGVLQLISMPYEKIGARLDLTAEELRAVLGNLQRYMHDLNSIAHFTDIAKAYVQDRIKDQSQPVDQGSPLPTRAEAFDIVHLSHVQEIAERVQGDSNRLRDRYGAKGAGLIGISFAGIPTRDGFILPTDLARSGIHRSDRDRLEQELFAHLRTLEEDITRRDGTVCRFGDPERPLLLAVRGGSVFSMPGILATIVFVGMNDRIAETLAADDPWYAYDTYRRFLTSWADTVVGIDLEAFELVEDAKRRHSVRYKQDLPWEAMRDVAEDCKTILRERGYSDSLDELLEQPSRQLLVAVDAVLKSWDTAHARRYRQIKGMSHSWNTAVIVQQMSSGNRRNDVIVDGMDETRCSLTGVVPRTQVTPLGLRRLSGDIKFSAAGDDLVGGLTAADSFEPIQNLRRLMPMLERRLEHLGARIRIQQGTDVELEFTVERGVLSILQARAAETALHEEAGAFEDSGEAVVRGIGIRGGAFRGLVAFDDKDLEELSRKPRDDDSGEVDGVLLLLENPTPEEIPMILSADGLLTARGGSTSHAAVAIHAIADKPFSAVLGVAGLRVQAKRHEARLVDAEGRELYCVRKGDVVSINGRTGEVFVGSLAVVVTAP